jgi:hypothetical protein
MIDLNSLLRYDEIKNLGYDTIYLEQPVADIVYFDWKNILEPPPPNTSKQTLTELQTVSSATFNRNKKDIDLVHRIDQDPDSYFIDLTDKYKLSYPVSSIQEFYSIIKPILLNIKGIWNRPRPAQLAKYYNIPIDVMVSDTHHTASYPSGHTVYSSLVALILKHVYPVIDQRKLDILVNNTAKARVLQGVHFPSDNKASIKLIKFLFNKLKDDIL